MRRASPARDTIQQAPFCRGCLETLDSVVMQALPQGPAPPLCPSPGPRPHPATLLGTSHATLCTSELRRRKRPALDSHKTLHYFASKVLKTRDATYPLPVPPRGRAAAGAALAGSAAASVGQAEGVTAHPGRRHCRHRHLQTGVLVLISTPRPARGPL